MKLKGFTALAALALIAFAALVLSSESVSAQAPPNPMFFGGTVTVAGNPAPDGYNIFARVDDYQSPSVMTENGRYAYVTVGPPAPRGRNPYEGQEITFYLDGVQAAQTYEYTAAGLPDVRTLNLTFTGLPTPTPTITPIPTNTPVHTPTPANTPVPPTPVPPTPTPTPSIADPMTFTSGLIVAVSGAIPADAVLTARIGGYESAPATIAPDGNYFGLIVDPKDASLIGQDIGFFLNGIESRTTEQFASGAVQSLDLLFQLPEVPTPTPEPTPTSAPVPEPPTPTPAPPTLEPTATPMPEPPTATPEPPTPAPEPTAAPEPTPVPPTATPEPPPTNTPMAREAPPPPPEQSGGCGSPTSDLPFGTAAANLALLLAPLGLLGIRKLRIRHR